MGTPTPCEKCGRDIYRALMERYPVREVSLVSQKIPDFPTGMKTITLPLEQIKEFNADYNELAQFAAWVCDVTVEKFCRSDMMRATGDWKRIANRMRLANEEDEL